MQSLFQQIKAGQVWDFHGGIHPPARKQHTSHKPIGRMPLPERLYVPLRQHIGVAGSLLVVVGQQVLKGQPLTFADNAMAVPVHAPTSGTIIAIESHIAPHPSALPEPCVVIAPDGLDQWRDRLPMNLLESDRLTILQRIQEAGIAGMGGAGFPTHLKTGAAGGIDYLIVNAVECEPYISADDVLMQEFATTIVKGIDILCELLSPAAVLIGIEDDKPLAIAAMQAACSQRDNYLVKVVPAKYPSGGEKQLIQLLTSKEVPAGRRPLDIGIVMQNVGTVFAIAQAVLEDMPLISRIVTVVGDSLSQPQNVLALIGTPVGYLLDFCGFIPEPAQRVIMGGPMMGFTLPSVSVPVVKTSNCILAPTQTELPAANQEMDCIRCGACAEVCPAVLLPQQLLWYSKAKDQDKLKEYNLADCIECGACAYVCPSEIPLVHYYRVAKAEIREQTRDELKAEQAKARFEARNARLEQEKQQRAARNQALALQRQQLMAEQQKNREIEQAQQRVATANAPELADMSKEQIIALREQKKAEARAYQAQKAQQQSSSATGVSDSTATLSTTTEQAPAANKSADDSLDPRATAVAAAIARAKAKKAQAEPATTAASNDAAPDQTPVEASPVQDPRAAAVAAAIARAKAKKAQAEPATTPASNDAAPDQTPVEATPVQDPRAAAVAAAIARAKAKKAQAEPATTPVSNDAAPEQTPVEASPVQDPRAAAVAAAIARAKAKKAQAEALSNTTVAAPMPPSEQSNDKVESNADTQTKIDLVIAASSDAEPSPDREAAKRQALTAAIAKAQAKRQQENVQSTSAAAKASSVQSEDEDHARSNDHPITNETAISSTTATDPRKAAIAAAIARAKAKQQQLSATDPKDQA